MVLRSQRGVGTLSGVLIAGLMLAVAVLIFFGIYLSMPQNQHFYALLWIGVLGLVFGFATYFAQAFLRDPAPARFATFGFVGMGFTVLFLTVLIAPGNPFTLGSQLAALVVLILLLIAVVAFAMWRARELGREARRSERRQEWTASPPASALDYPAARAAAAPPAATPTSSGSPPSRPGGTP